jgi:hypothetical protein
MVYVEHGYLVSGLYPSSSVFIFFILLNTGRWIESRNQITMKHCVWQLKSCDFCLPGCDAVYSGRGFRTFRRNVHSPFLCPKSKPNK